MIRPRDCGREGEVLRAVGAGEPPAELATHLGVCPACRDAAAAQRLLALVAPLAGEARLPEPAALLARARQRRQAAAM
ncbi:MAG TPA: hypothetical protein VMT16_10730, partial [Thermoanaerobaculia bacterium]|nr:hypothetical protein [Thermoanaerobaculia bacterium]